MKFFNKPTREQMKKLVGMMIEFWRKKRKLNETQLGSKCGKTCSKISSYELGRRLADSFEHQKVAYALKISLSELYNWKLCPQAMEYIIKHKLNVNNYHNSTNN